MKKLNQAQKKAYPKYIIQIDTRASSKLDGFYQKAAESENLFEVMKKVETCVRARFEDIYIVEIFEKTNNTTDYNEPLYESAIMTRVEPEGYNFLQPVNWHFRAEPMETEYKRPHIWYPSGKEDRKGTLESYAI